MIKVKIKKKRGLKEGEDSKIDSGLSRIQKYNQDIFLQEEYLNSGRGRGDFIIHNFIEDIANQKFEKTGDADIFDTVYNDTNPVTLVTELVKNISPLSNNKIKKAITGDSFGKIFKLDNEHILKIFLGGVNVEEDFEWYRKCYDLLHSGGAKRTTLPVYDMPKNEDGKVNLPSFPDFDVYWVEMAEFEPLDKFFKRAGREEADTALLHLKSVFKSAYEQGYKLKKDVMIYIYDFIGINKVESAIDHLFYYLKLDKETVTTNKKEDYIKFIFDYLDIDKSKYSSDINKNIDAIYKNLKINRDEASLQFSPDTNPFKPLTVNEAESIIEAFCDMLEMGFKLSDVTTKNLAILIQSDPVNPTIIIFDR